MQQLSSLFPFASTLWPPDSGGGTAILLFCSYCESNLFYIDFSLEWPIKRGIPFCSQFPKHFCNNIPSYSQTQLTVFHCTGQVWGTNVQKTGLCCRVWNKMPCRGNIFPLLPAVSGFNLPHLHRTWFLLPFSLPRQSVQKALQILFVLLLQPLST